MGRRKPEAVFFFRPFLAFIPIFIGRQAKEMDKNVRQRRTPAKVKPLLRNNIWILLRFSGMIWRGLFNSFRFTI
jgi:hypothetical protein